VIRPEKKPQGFENYSSMGPAVRGDDRFEQQSTPNPGDVLFRESGVAKKSGEANQD